MQEELEEERKALEARKRVLDDLEPLEEQRLRQLKSETEALLNIADAYDESDEAVLKAKKSYEELTEQNEKFLASLTAGNEKVKMGAQILGLEFGGAFQQLTKVIPLSLTELRGFGGGLVDLVSSGELAKITLAGLYNAALEVADAGAAFVGATGAATSLTDSIADTRNELRELGVDGAMAGQAAQTLFKDFSDFSNLNKSLKSDLMGQAALLDNIGVSMGTTAGIFDQATKSLGYTSTELVGLTQDIQNVAQSVGKTSEEVFSDFGKVAESLAFYGKDAIKVFTELEKQSKATGLSVDKLVSISGKAFDTFDGAAQKIGRLNAILGGPYLNSIDMLNASEAERIEMLKQSMDMSGQVFNDLNKFEQLAIADALGVGVEDARRMFGNLSAAQQMNIREQEKIAETAKNAMKQMAKLTAAIQSLFVAFKPVVDAIVGFTDGLSWLISSKGGKVLFYILALVSGFALLGGAISKIGSAFGSMKKGLNMLKSPIETVKEGFKSGAGGGGLADEISETARAAEDSSEVIGGSFIDTFKDLMEAVKGSYKEMLAFGAAILMIGGGIAVAALGLAQLVKAFVDLSGPQALGAVAGLLVVMGGFAIMLKILAAASLVAAGPLIAVGVAFLAIGGGIALAALG